MDPAGPAAGPAVDDGREPKRSRPETPSYAPGEHPPGVGSDVDVPHRIQDHWQRLREFQGALVDKKKEGEELETKIEVRHNYLALADRIDAVLNTRRDSIYPEEAAIFGVLDRAVTNVDSFTDDTTTWVTELDIVRNEITNLETRIESCRTAIDDLQAIPCPDHRRAIDYIPIELWAYIFMFVGPHLFRAAIFHGTYHDRLNHTQSKVWLVSKFWLRAWRYIKLDDKVRMMYRHAYTNWRYESRCISTWHLESIFSNVGNTCTFSLFMGGGRYLLEGYKKSIVMEHTIDGKVRPHKTIARFDKNPSVSMIIRAIAVWGSPDDEKFQVYIKVARALLWIA